MNNREYWSGNLIKSLQPNEVFVFGSNPEGIHGAGGAKAALLFGAKFGKGRGLIEQTYALVTKNLHAGFKEKDTGIIYDKEGYCSVSKEQISNNIQELYNCAQNNPNKKFLITFQYESFPNGNPKKSLNGYNSQEMLEMFIMNKEIPNNIVFHESYKQYLENINTTQNKYTPEQYTFFFHLTSPFSNFHPSKFEYKDLTFISNEQFMMYSKAKNFNDELTAKKIISINNEPLAKDFIEGKISRKEIIQDKELSAQWQNLMMKAKKLGRGVQNYDDDFWNKRRTNIVLFGAREKFNQNPELKEILMNTGNTLMVEASPRDLIWGIGLSEYEAKKIPPEEWKGLNLLGKILDKLKLEFKNELNINKKIKP